MFVLYGDHLFLRTNECIVNLQSFSYSYIHFIAEVDSPVIIFSIKNYFFFINYNKEMTLLSYSIYLLNHLSLLLRLTNQSML